MPVRRAVACRAIFRAYLEFAHAEPGLFATAFSMPHQHAYGEVQAGKAPLPLDQLRVALDELVDAGVLDPARRAGIEYPIWSTVHGLAVLSEQGPLREVPDAALRASGGIHPRIHRMGPGVTQPRPCHNRTPQEHHGATAPAQIVHPGAAPRRSTATTTPAYNGSSDASG